MNTVTDHGVEPLRQRLDPAERAHRVERLPEFLGVRARACQPQIVRERPGEDMHLLGDEPDQVTGLVRFGAADVDPARLRAVQSRDQLGQGRLARTGRTDQRHPLLGPDLQVDVVQHRAARHIRVGDTGQRHGRGTTGRRTVVGAVGDHRRGFVHDPDEACQPGRCRLGVVEQHQRGVDRAEETGEVQGGRGGRTDRRGTVAHQKEPGDEHGGQPQVLGDVQPAVEAQHQLDAAHGQFDRRARAFGDPPAVILLQPVRPYGPRSADRVQQLLLLSAGGDALLGVQGNGVAHIPARGVRLHRHRDQRGQQEPPVQQGERAQRQHDRQRGPRQLGQRPAHGVGDPRNIPRDTGVEVTGTGLLHPVQGERQGPLDEEFAQPRERGLAEPGDERHPECGGHALHHRHPGERDHREGERVGGAVLGDDVDDVAQQRLGEQSDGRGEHHEPEPGGGQTPLRAQEFTDRGAGAGGGGGGEESAVRVHAGVLHLFAPCCLGSRRHASTAVR